MTKHGEKEQGKTQNETPRSNKQNVIQSKNNTRTIIALERLVGTPLWGLKHVYSPKRFTLGPDITFNTKIHKNEACIMDP